MKKYVLMLLVLTISICFVACNSEPPAVECPSWSAPQPVDSLLLGTWELVESSDNHFNLSINEITFYDNNYFLQTFGKDESNIQQAERRWSAALNTLVLPDFCDCSTERFLDYNYSLSADSTLLYVESASYPHIGREGKNCNAILVIPLFVQKGTFKRAE